MEHNVVKHLIRFYDNEQAPEPDLTYGFPIYTPTDAPQTGFGELDCGRTFHAEVLRILQQKMKIIPALTTGLSKRSNLNGLKTSDLLCYPWAIVEFKHAVGGNSDKVKCIGQGKRAAKCALDMLRLLFEEATESVPDDLPPIIFFTCVGPEVQVWLAYHLRLGNDAYSNSVRTPSP